MAGEEILVVDSNGKDREDLRAHFDAKGLVTTTAGSRVEARRVLAQKFFPVALVDLDVDEQGGGLEVLQTIRASASPTIAFALTGRRTFDGAVASFRAGAADVFFKSPDQIERLGRAVETALVRAATRDPGGQFHRDVRDVLHDAFKVMLEQARVVYADLSAALPPLRPRIFVVESDPATLDAIARKVRAEGWDLQVEMSGGGALDRASRTPVDILAVRDDLPDLRGSMVLKSLQAERAEMMGLLYGAPGPGASVARVERGRVEPGVGPLRSLDDLIEAMRRLSSELSTKAQERRIIEAFRGDHPEFLRRFAKVKKRLDTLVDD